MVNAVHFERTVKCGGGVGGSMILLRVDSLEDPVSLPVMGAWIRVWVGALLEKRSGK